MKSPMPKATSSTLCKNRGTIVAGPSRGPAAARHDSGVSVRALQAPRVSVLLPVWNGEAFLEQAMESILRQTLSSFELILIDDGSTDRTAAIAEEFAFRDTRVRVLRRPHEGFSATLNAGIEAARGEYVARMDADDLSLPDRLRKQVAYLDIHPACVAVGAWIEVVDEAGRHIGLKTFVTTHDEISAVLLCGISPMAHPTVLFRRDVVRAAGGYDARRYPSEDLDLWFRLGERGELANLGEVLLQHLGTAVALHVNFAISGIERVIRELRAALNRRKRESLAARRDAEQLLRSELKGTVTALLLTCEIALEVPNLPTPAEDKLRAVYDLAREMRIKIGLNQ